MKTRRCYQCEQDKPETEKFFYKRTRVQGGWHSPCRACMAERALKWEAELRRAALLHYSYGTLRCACCQEGIYEFLVIDHVDGGGGRHRRDLGGGTKIYRWLKKAEYPGGFRVLCSNCNHAIGHWGRCPHPNGLTRGGSHDEDEHQGAEAGSERDC